MSIKNEMTELKEQVLKMCSFVVKNINDSINYYLGKQQDVQINDDLVDQYERLIEEMCINILLKERLFAKDLKEVTGALKLVSDLERIGDHAEDIYEFSKRIKKYQEQRIDEISGLSDFVIEMINKSIKSYVNNDYDMAKEVIKDDDFVDKKYEEIIESLGNEEKYDKDYLPFAIYTTLVVKYLERIADHSVNIAEWVVYISSGFYKDKMIF